MSDKFKALLPHLVVAVIFLILSILYTKPILENKVLYQYDMVQSQGASHEVLEYEKKTGEHSLWTNSMFSGMPTYTIVGNYPMSFTSRIAGTISYLLPQPANIIFYLLIGFYIMMAVLGFNPWLSAIGAIGFAFSSYNLISLEAGHVSKVFAIAYAPPLVAGIILLYNGKFIKGTIVTAIFLFFELYANHVQISYYLFIALLLYVIYQFVISILNKSLKEFFIASAIVAVIAVLGVGSMASKFWTTYEYSKYTIRGASELKSNTQSKGGLDKDYAYSWSYGIDETFTFLIPDYYGGASTGSLSNDSETYKVVKKLAGSDAAKSFVDRLPLYWGSQPNTGGPAYIGAIICFLFVLSFFVVKNTMKWWVLAVVVLFTMLSWGKNFYALTDLFFYHVPMYNKFRAVTMIHALVSMLMCFMGLWGVKTLIENNEVREGLADKPLKLATIVVGGFLLLMTLFGSSLFSFEKLPESEDPKAKSGDEYFVGQLEQMTQSKEVAGQIYDALLEDRASLLQKDAFRSLILVLLAAGLLWFYVKGKYKAVVVYVGLSVLVLFDMWSVAKRYLNNDDFMPKKKYQTEFEPSPADATILADPDPDFKVMNTTVSTFNDATTSYFHKSIGGYSAAKLRRYQDLIEKHISEGNMNVLNMLNTKYFIQQGQEGPVAARNPGALGHAWFVKEIRWVKDADAEINALKDFRPENTAVIDEKYKNVVGNASLHSDTTARIELKEYKPNHLTYESETSGNQLAVFSEIYYNNELGWESYVDGKPVPHFRVNYVLRGMMVPAGKHKIEFVFHPKSYFAGEKISLICSLLLLGGIVGLTFIKIKKPKDEDLYL